MSKQYITTVHTVSAHSVPFEPTPKSPGWTLTGPPVIVLEHSSAAQPSTFLMVYTWVREVIATEDVNH